MRVAGIIQPGTTLGYVVQSQDVQGTLIVCQTIEERDALVNSGSQAIVDGTPIYVAGTKKTYRYNEPTKLFQVEPTFTQDENGVICIVGESGEPEKLKLDVSIDDLDPTFKEEIESLPTEQDVEVLIEEKLNDYVTLTYFGEKLSELEEIIKTKQDILIAGENISIDGNVISAIIGGHVQVKFINRDEFPVQGEEDVLYVAKDEKQIYLWDVSTSSYAIITDDTVYSIINGGKAD